MIGKQEKQARRGGEEQTGDTFQDVRQGDIYVYIFEQADRGDVHLEGKKRQAGGGGGRKHIRLQVSGCMEN